jgi:bla regulator protein BlaR1
MRLPTLPTDGFVAALVNHLWQSTAVVLAVWLLAYALRNNRAGVRYWLWMIASLKFLLPFSLLIAAGELFHPAAALVVARPALANAMEQIVQPFPQTTIADFSSAASLAQGGKRLFITLFILWAGGSLVVSVRWWRRWMRMRDVLRASAPQTSAGDVPVVSSPSLLEPGVFGIVRPVLLLPEGIMDRLTTAQMNALFTHELCHVRRRDNLTYALHMAVETLFWFHPLVWWVGARLVEERERACDESVLQSGNEAEVYAESILSVCKFYVESPLACASGVSGSDLKKRIVRIMTNRVVRNLAFSRKLLLWAAGLAAIAIPTAIGLFHFSGAVVLARAQDAPADIPKFDVVSIKPNKSGEMRIMMRFLPDGITMEGVPAQLMLTQAFNVEEDRIIGAPGWVKTDRYDIQAKVAPEDALKLDKLKREERMSMLQPLLAERFNLKFHHETREMPVYVLVVAKGGPKLKEAAAPTASATSGGPPRRGMMMGIGTLEANGAQIDMLAHALSGQVGRTVIDKTGLTGNYDFNLHFTPEQMPPRMGPGPGPGPDGGRPGADAPPPPDVTGPDIFTAVQEQLGLKLESEKGPVDVIVIDHIDKPSEN